MERLDTSPDVENRDEMWGELYYHLAMTVLLVMPFITTDAPPLIPSIDGAQRIPVYTNEDDLRVNFPDALDDDRWIPVSFDDLRRLLDKAPDAAGIVVDLPSMAWIFDRDALDAIAEKRQEVTVKSRAVRDRNMTVFVAHSEDFPHKLADALSRFAARDQRIEKMWLRSVERGEVPGYLVVVQSAGLTYKLLTDLYDTAQPHMSPEEQVHFVSDDSKLGSFAISHLMPFYKRTPR